MNVLLSCAGRRAYMVDYFRHAVGVGGRVLVTNSEPNAAAMVTADGAFLAPPLAAAMSGDDSYVCFLLELCRQEHVTMVVPLFDLELPLLAPAIDRFAAVGVTVAVSSPEVVAVCDDKWATAGFVCEHAGLAGPRTTFDPLEAEAWLVDGAAEVWVKPRFGTGSIATWSTSHADEVGVLYRKVHRDQLSSYLRQPTDGEPDVVLQEGLRGQEYGLTVVNDFYGTFQAVLVNRKLAMRAGETDIAVAEHHDVLVATGRQLASALGHVGALDVDVFVDGSTVAVLELNARFGGSYPFSHLAGADVPAAYVAWARGEQADQRLFDVAPGTIGLKSIHPLRV